MMNILSIMVILIKMGKKIDNNAYYYSSELNIVFHGEIEENIFVSGYVGSFDEEKDKLIEFLFCEFNEDGNIKNIIKEKDLIIDGDEISDEKEKIEISETLFQTEIIQKIYIVYSRQ